MKKQYKPQGYNSLSPYFVVNGAEKLADLLKALFQATEKRRYETPEGNIMHLELQIDDSMIMMGDAADKFPVYTHLVHVYVPDVDETYKKALELGCESVYPPGERPGDPNKRGAVKDFAGNIWTLATQL
jgi:uncharacterized glyoxalase superfamily protein PhnB